MNISIHGNAFYTSEEAFTALSSFVRNISQYHSDKFWAMVKRDERLDNALFSDDHTTLLGALVSFVKSSDLNEDANDWFDQWATHKEVEWCDSEDDDLLSWQRMELLESLENENQSDYWHSVAN